MQNILAERTEIDDKLLRISPQVDDFERYSDAHVRFLTRTAAKPLFSKQQNQMPIRYAVTSSQLSNKGFVGRNIIAAFPETI